MSGSARRAALVAAVRDDREPGDLARACLLVAQGEYPALDAPGVIAALAAFGVDVRTEIEGGRTATDALRSVLGDRAGFCGRREGYDEPENSHLNCVLERRHGLPLLLSVVWIEVARVAGVPAAGVGLPGHFIVRIGVGDAAEYVDPFEGGVRRTARQALALAARLTGQRPPLGVDWLRPVGTHAIVTRLLANLVATYERRGDLARLERVLGDHLALQPDAAPLLVRRGHVRAARGNISAALADLNRALEVLPPGDVFRRVHASAARLARSLESLN